MKGQDINLLATAPRSSSRHPTARQIAIALSAVIVSGVTLGFWQESRRASLEQAVQVLNADIDGIMIDLEERSQFLTERNADPVLVADLKRREREVDDKSRVLDVLSGESVGNAGGFSAHLAALGRRHPEGLWLETILIADGGRQLMLAGRTLQASLVPRFLAELQAEPALAGTAFATFTLSGDEDAGEPMSFALATGCTDRNTVDETRPVEPCQPFETSLSESIAAADVSP